MGCPLSRALPCDAWSLRNLFKLKGPTQQLKMAKKSILLPFWTANPIFWPFWAAEWVPWVCPVMPVPYANPIFLAIMSCWVGPLSLKRLRKDQSSHGNALDTPHSFILKRKKWLKINWLWLAFEKVEERPSHGIALDYKNDYTRDSSYMQVFYQLLSTFHWF